MLLVTSRGLVASLHMQTQSVRLRDSQLPCGWPASELHVKLSAVQVTHTLQDENSDQSTVEVMKYPDSLPVSWTAVCAAG